MTSSWIEGLSTSALVQWAPALRSSLNVLIILAFAWVALAVVHRGVRRFRIYMEARAPSEEEARRVGTLCRAFRYVGSVGVYAIAVMLVMNELGISIAPILATAGVAGVAIGFGAQSLVKDYLAGLFLLIEDQIRQGDVVQIAGIGGQVEEMTLRHVRLRDFDGHVHFVPNGEIRAVTNRTRDYAQSVIDASIAYREDVDEVLDVMRAVGRALRADPDWAPRILDDIEIIGVERWADSAVILRCRLRVVPIQQWNVRREYLRRLKAAFDLRGIEIPYPQLTIHPGAGKDDGAPAFRLKAN